MIHNIDANYDHGVLRPIEPLALPEGARVHLRVEEVISSPTKSSAYKAWLESVAGRWQGEFVGGSEGIETSAPIF
jgi:predicted DNA-binding antitoxin AbrB/MazE fold protein